jgi:hypothetical protein
MMKKYTKHQVQVLLDEKRDLAVKDVRTLPETERLRELNHLLREVDYQYFTPLWLRLVKRVGKFLMKVSERINI